MRHKAFGEARVDAVSVRGATSVGFGCTARMRAPIRAARTALCGGVPPRPDGGKVPMPTMLAARQSPPVGSADRGPGLVVSSCSETIQSGTAVDGSDAGAPRELRPNMVTRRDAFGGGRERRPPERAASTVSRCARRIRASTGSLGARPDLRSTGGRTSCPTPSRASVRDVPDDKSRYAILPRRRVRSVPPGRGPAYTTILTRGDRGQDSPSPNAASLPSATARTLRREQDERRE